MELGFNGETTPSAVTSSGAAYTFNDVLFNVASIVPLGGPAAGGTHVTVALGDGYEPLSPLADLGGYLHGPHCRFTHASGWKKTVAASLSAGGEALLCDSPAFSAPGTGPSRRHTLRMDADLKVGYVGPELDTSHPVYLEVTLNRQQYTQTNQTFTFYDERDACSITRRASLSRVGRSGGRVSQCPLAGWARCHFETRDPCPPRRARRRRQRQAQYRQEHTFSARRRAPGAVKRNGDPVELTLSVGGSGITCEGSHALIFSYIMCSPSSGSVPGG